MSQPDKSDPVPSVGRIVHFFAGSGTPVPAIIVSVDQGSDTLNLVVFDLGGAISRWTIPKRTDGAEFVHCWDWPERV